MRWSHVNPSIVPEIYSSFNELTHHPEEQTRLSVEKNKNEP